ncbi:DUF697 domain-containing protein [Betaproteobacteria bacterium SCN2]|jgi:hypothetical protein|nr:DUF697 domain-containing protein [Betaproteobacteria bacterium SCN2]
MKKPIARILTLLAILVLLYLGLVIVASVTQIADAADRIYLGAGQPLFWVMIVALVLLLLIPVYLYLRLPKPLIQPATDSGPEYEKYLAELLLRMQKNPLLRGMPLDIRDNMSIAMSKLSLEADKVIKDTASTVFVSTAVMQNGRLDGLVVLATQFRMVWRIASIFYQRPSPRQMLYLYSNVGATALIADSLDEVQFTELAAPLVASIFPSLKGAIPGLQGIAALLVNSIASGSANAFLTLRVGIVARQYCESLVAPQRNTVRQAATVSALTLVREITTENGARVVQTVGGAIRDAVGGVVDSTVQGVKNATGKVVDTTVSTTMAVGGAISSKTKGVMKAAEKLTTRKEPG